MPMSSERHLRLSLKVRLPCQGARELRIAATTWQLTFASIVIYDETHHFTLLQHPYAPRSLDSPCAPSCAGRDYRAD